MSPRQKPPPMPEKGAAALIEAFLEMMSAERGAGANTLAAYRRDLLDFAGHPKKGLAGASRDEVKAYLRGLSPRASRPPPRRAGCRRCASFTAFCSPRRCAPDNPTDAVDSPARRGRCRKSCPPPTWTR
jgi:integrase/recombinase XerD